MNIDYCHHFEEVNNIVQLDVSLFGSDKFCTNHDQGITLNKLIMKALSNDKYVYLYFDNVEMLISDFIIAALFNAYKTYQWPFLKERLIFIDKNSMNKNLIGEAIKNIKNKIKDGQKNVTGINYIT